MNDNIGDSPSATVVSVPPSKASSNPVASPTTPSVTPAPTSGGGSGINRNEQQVMKKLKDANLKYKDLLKLAKERIQAQEEELENLKSKRMNCKFFFSFVFCTVVCTVRIIIMCCSNNKKYSLLNTNVFIHDIIFLFCRGIEAIKGRKA